MDIAQMVATPGTSHDSRVVGAAVFFVHGDRRELTGTSAMLFTLAVRGEVSNHLMHTLRYLRANGWMLSEQHWVRPLENMTAPLASSSDTRAQAIVVLNVERRTLLAELSSATTPPEL
jgi:hypothetical protein